MEVHIIPVLNDNYNFIFHSPQSGHTTVVDPSDAAPIISFLQQQNWKLDTILNTHHHADHTGGNLELKGKYACEIYASEPDKNRIPGIDHTLSDGDKLKVGDFSAEVLFLPGHTLGHIAYYFPAEAVVFCGDVLFAMGCGRLFEGSASQMHTSLSRLKSLPDDTKVYCAHEYSEANARFAITVEPENEELKRRYSQVQKLRKSGAFTVPTTIAAEKHTNPFVRAINCEDFARIRKLKDNF